MFCSSIAAERWGDEWRAAAPGIDLVPLVDGQPLTEEDLARIQVAVFTNDIWTTGGGPAFFSVLFRAPALQWLHACYAGLDHPVYNRLREQGVRLTNSAGASATPIAHTVMMHVIALCRDARRFAVAQSKHEWPEREVSDVEGRTMGIIGLGSIGAEVARLAAHFGIRVIGMRRTPSGDEPCETWPTSRLHELLPLVDDLVLTAPLTDETRNMIGAHELSLLRPGAHLVNVGRGELVDEPALAAALTSGHLGGAALDVFVVEPLPADSPLWDLPNVIITPHSAGGTPLGAVRAVAIFTDNLGRWVRGEPLRNDA